ncbi:DUF1330 domain-containing protein [soil metagenome]
MSGHVDLTKERFIAHRENERDGVVHLLNLLRLRERAAYPDGRVATGTEAYQTYGRISEPVLARLGATIVWEGRFETMLIGPDEERWDLSFVAEYPSIAAFNEVLRDPVYREAAAHRKAAAEDSRLIRLAALPKGTRFGQFL